MENSGISWTDHTFNPWIGCTKYGPGCDHCYAEALMDHRYHKVVWGKGEARQRTAPSYWRQPVTWNDQPWVECFTCHWRGDVRKARLVENAASFHPPARARICPQCSEPTLQETRARVFCASLADVFDAEVDPSWRADLFRLIASTPRLDWLLLTKRIGDAERMIEQVEMILGGGPWPTMVRPNVWIGATMVTQRELERDLPKLLATPAAKRFISAEPLLGALNFLDASASWPRQGHPWLNAPLLTGIDWVITGGESGNGARECEVPWIRSIVEQCKAVGVPVHVKQLGANARRWCAARLEASDPSDDAECGDDFCDVYEAHEGGPCNSHGKRCVFMTHPKGGDLNEWPDGLRIQEFPK